MHDKIKARYLSLNIAKVFFSFHVHSVHDLTKRDKFEAFALDLQQHQKQLKGLKGKRDKSQNVNGFYGKFIVWQCW